MGTEKSRWWGRFIYYLGRALRIVRAVDKAYEKEMELKKKDKKDE